MAQENVSREGRKGDPAKDPSEVLLAVRRDNSLRRRWEPPSPEGARLTTGGYSSETSPLYGRSDGRSISKSFLKSADWGNSDPSLRSWVSQVSFPTGMIPLGSCFSHNLDPTPSLLSSLIPLIVTGSFGMNLSMLSRTFPNVRSLDSSLDRPTVSMEAPSR